MRIRKRFPPSSPLSDPQLNRSPVVQQTSLQLHPNGNIRVQEAKNDSQPSDPLNQPPLRPLPSDQQTIIAAERSKMILISDHELKIKQKQGEKERCTEKQDQESNNPRKESILLGVPIAHTGSLPPVSTSHQVDERWHEGDKEIPLKKRRGSFLGRMRGETIMLEKEKKMKPKMKSKTNKKCSALPNSDEQDKEKESKEIYSSSTNSAVKKMNKRGSVIMEGSRCSRVNGRGWRCCQQTLVGYSLCEHHLGKGRLRSITSVRSRATGAPITTINTSTSTIAPQPQHDIKFERLSSVSSSSLSLVQSVGQDAEEILLDDSYDDEDDDNDDDYDDDEKKKKKPVLVRKKRMKPGMVKARSLSSLLNQTNNVVAVATGNWNSSN